MKYNKLSIMNNSELEMKIHLFPQSLLTAPSIQDADPDHHQAAEINNYNDCNYNNQ